MQILEGYWWWWVVFAMLYVCFYQFSSFLFTSCMAGTFHWCGSMDGRANGLWLWKVQFQTWIFLQQAKHIFPAAVNPDIYGWTIQSWNRFPSPTNRPVGRWHVFLFSVFCHIMLGNLVYTCVLFVWFVVRATGAWSVPGTQRKQCEGSSWDLGSCIQW